MQLWKVDKIRKSVSVLRSKAENAWKFVKCEACKNYYTSKSGSGCYHCEGECNG